MMLFDFVSNHFRKLEIVYVCVTTISGIHLIIYIQYMHIFEENKIKYTINLVLITHNGLVAMVLIAPAAMAETMCTAH